MENKLQKLTEQLYEEGLSKGRTDAEKLVSDAEAKAKSIVAEAEKKAAAIVGEAEKKAAETSKNAMTEISLAGRSAIAALKTEINNMIVTKAVSGAVKQADMDVEFIKNMMLTVARNWNGASSDKVSLSVMLPEAQKAEFDKSFEASATEILSAGIEVGYSKNVKSGFKIGAKGGSYYISFSDEDFDALLGGYLREKVSKLLYSEK